MTVSCICIFQLSAEPSDAFIRSGAFTVGHLALHMLPPSVGCRHEQRHVFVSLLDESLLMNQLEKTEIYEIRSISVLHSTRTVTSTVFTKMAHTQVWT